MYTKKQVLDEMRRIATSLGANSLTTKDFARHSEISVSTVRYLFGSHNEAIKEAGLQPTDVSKITKERLTIEDDSYLKDLIRLYNEFGKEPTFTLVNAKGKFSVRPYIKRWKTIKEAFAIAMKKFGGEINNVKQADEKNNLSVQEIKIIPETIKPKDDKKKRQIFGEPINFRGLRFAPVNEQGVVYLFGMTSHELGYLIESVRTSFPDCEGKRCFDKENNQWEHVQIEFEYRSSNFKEHGHDPNECDVIVCWIHDWQDCPVEVLELKSTIKYLGPKS